jgi:hypothetical protein
LHLSEKVARNLQEVKRENFKFMAVMMEKEESGFWSIKSEVQEPMPLVRYAVIRGEYFKMEEEKIKTEIKEKEHKVKVENIKDEIKEETVIKKVKKDIKVNDKDLLDKLTFKKEDIKGTQNRSILKLMKVLI